MRYQNEEIIPLPVYVSRLATRAVHLEMAYALNTDIFINAFSQITARRRTSSFVLSDNGTNFVCAEKEICQKIQELNKQKIVEIIKECKELFELYVEMDDRVQLWTREG